MPRTRLQEARLNISQKIKDEPVQSDEEDEARRRPPQESEDVFKTETADETEFSDSDSVVVRFYVDKAGDDELERLDLSSIDRRDKFTTPNVSRDEESESSYIQEDVVPSSLPYNKTPRITFVCPVCEKAATEDVLKITLKRREQLVLASSQREDELFDEDEEVENLQVHKACYKAYISKRNIAKDKKDRLQISLEMQNESTASEPKTPPAKTPSKSPSPKVQQQQQQPQKKKIFETPVAPKIQTPMFKRKLNLYKRNFAEDSDDAEEGQQQQQQQQPGARQRSTSLCEQPCASPGLSVSGGISDRDASCSDEDGGNPRRRRARSLCLDDEIIKRLPKNSILPALEIVDQWILEARAGGEEREIVLQELLADFERAREKKPSYPYIARRLKEIYGEKIEIHNSKDKGTLLRCKANTANLGVITF